MNALHDRRKPRKQGKLAAWRDEEMRKRIAAGVTPDPNAGSQEDFEAGFNFIMDSLWGRIGRIIHQRSSPTTVYTFRAENGAVLYVGVSLDALARFGAHAGRSWWREVSDIALEHYPDRCSALNRETQLIAALKPIHNIAKGVTR